jgi:hypothetical protein
MSATDYAANEIIREGTHAQFCHLLWGARRDLEERRTSPLFPGDPWAEFFFFTLARLPYLPGPGGLHRKCLDYYTQHCIFLSRFSQMRENAHTSSTETWELWVHFQRVCVSLFIGNAFPHRKVIKSRKYNICCAYSRAECHSRWRRTATRTNYYI